MHWTGPPPASLSAASATALEEGDDDDDDPDWTVSTRAFNPHNKCKQVWQGLAVKRLFPHGFTFQACESHEQARKILQAKGAAHYWDQVVRHAKKGEQQFENYLPFKLTTTTTTTTTTVGDQTSENETDQQNSFRQDEDNSEDEDHDIIMKDS
jgi:hypothetical protein